MLFDRFQIDRIKSANPIEDVIGAEIDLTKCGSEYKALCPFHQEKTPSFYVKSSKGFFHCFGCGAHGDVVRWVVLRQGITFRQALEALARRAGISL